MYCEFVRRGVLVLDQVLGCGNKVVKYILLLQLRSSLVPLFTILAAAAHVCRGVNESLLEQRQSERAEARRVCEVESAITVKHCRVIAVELDSFFVNQKHRHLRAVFTRVEDLRRFVAGRFESRDFRLSEQRRLLSGDLVFVNRWGKVEGRESVKSQL